MNICTYTFTQTLMHTHPDKHMIFLLAHIDNLETYMDIYTNRSTLTYTAPQPHIPTHTLINNSIMLTYMLTFIRICQPTYLQHLLTYYTNAQCCMYKNILCWVHTACISLPYLASICAPHCIHTLTFDYAAQCLVA